MNVVMYTISYLCMMWHLDWFSALSWLSYQGNRPGLGPLDLWSSGIGDDLLLREVCFWYFHPPFHWNPWFFRLWLRITRIVSKFCKRFPRKTRVTIDWRPFFSLISTSTDYDLNLRQHGKFTTTADGWPHQQCLDTENVAVSTSRMVWMLSLLQCMEINIQKALWMMTPLYFIWMLTAMHFLDVVRYVQSGSCLHLATGNAHVQRPTNLKNATLKLTQN